MSSNRLIHETSPYLQQHAHNPVDWYPWGPEALEKAKEENKPILLSIGYSACHWCHVMERESFEDAEVAALMNEHFICIKADREERPDLDHIYMDAVQALTGSGGWPLNVFLTPELKPFYGGTYFPPKRMYNRPSWTEILLQIAKIFREKNNEINSQAENLTAYLHESGSLNGLKTDENFLPDKEMIRGAFQNLIKPADREWGGFGQAPKFPQTFSLQFLLAYSYLTGDKLARDHVKLSLDAMLSGGIYDQVGGGFARYSTDREWKVPHFEKMLYDNALLVSLYSDAFLFTGEQAYREIIEETMQFILREMTDPEGGFYAAIDADSEGVEGKFYTWKNQELENILGRDAKNFSAYYQATETGNWEHTNILFRKIGDGKNGPDKKEFEKNRQMLLANRDKRIRPGLDDKILLGWNALMNTACSKAFAATGKEDYRQMAIRNMNFLYSNLIAGEKEGFHHSWKNKPSGQPAFLDDYAGMIRALIQLQEITGERDWLNKAKTLAELVLERFSATESPLFYFASGEQADLVIRKKEIYDGATPSGNSIMAQNLLHLSVLFDIPDWKQRSQQMVGNLGELISRHPLSFGNWLILATEMAYGTREIAVTGRKARGYLTDILKIYLPHKILMISDGPEQGFPLLKGKAFDNEISLYLCSDYTCLEPVFSTMALREQLEFLNSQNISKIVQ